ncbi:MAG: type II CAAX endopeptidase family protein [Candidatus Limnocylindrales bacterium]
MADPSPAEPSSAGAPRADAPKSAGTFSLEGRPAAGLYLVGWLLSGLGLGLLFIAIQVAPPAGGLLLMTALLSVAVGFAASAGYQVIARASRPASAFRSASPAIVLALQLVLSLVLGTVWVVLGVPDPRESAPGFLVISLTLLASYMFVVWLFGVRTGAMRWRDMGVPVLSGRLAWAQIGRDVGFGGITMLIMWPLVTFLAGLLALGLGTRTADVVPDPVSSIDVLLTALGAGLFVPIGEEVFFRGYALTAWLRDRGARSALIRSTLFFAFAHVLGVTATTFDQGWRQALLTVVVITPVGAALGWLFLRRGLFCSIAGHATFNLVSVLAVTVAQSLPRPV